MNIFMTYREDLFLEENRFIITLFGMALYQKIKALDIFQALKRHKQFMILLILILLNLIVINQNLLIFVMIGQFGEQ